jgi:hypothetical protein
MLSGHGLSAMTANPASLSAMVGTLKPVNAAPTVAKSICVNGNAPIAGKTASLSVLGNDDGGESRLIYTWSVTSSPLGGTAKFSINGSNGAKLTTATFTKAGTYHFSVKIVDAGGLWVSGAKSAVVSSRLTSIVVSPGTACIFQGGSQQFAARAFDQFQQSMASQQAFL